MGHHPGRGAVLPPLSRHHLRGVLSGSVRRERAVPRHHGLGHAVVLSLALLRRAPGRPPRRLDAHRVLPTGRRPRLRNLLDDPPWRRGHGLQLCADGSHRVRTPKPWEDSPHGWPQEGQVDGSNTRINGRPIPQWSRSSKAAPTTSLSGPDSLSGPVLLGAQRAPRTNRPGRAPVSTPSRRVTTPSTIVARSRRPPGQDGDRPRAGRRPSSGRARSAHPCRSR